MLIRYTVFVFLAIPLLAGCSQPSNALPAHPLTAAMQLREKLNAMSVPDRLAYIKKHPDTVQTVAGGVSPLRMANMAKSRKVSSEGVTK